MPSDKPAPGNIDLHLRWHPQQVTRAMREARNGHRSVLVWFTGLPSSGKSTLAHGLEERLFADRRSAYVLDGDNVRHGLCRDLGFAEEDRAENIRRIGELANLFLDAGIITLAAFVSTYASDRCKVHKLVGAGNSVEEYCRCPIEVCEVRDEKRNYAKANVGMIARFTGISAPYDEAPASPDQVLIRIAVALRMPIATVLSLLHKHGVIAQGESAHAV
jgi:adenylylsulfate kinase